MNVEQIMRHAVRTCQPEDSLDTAAHAMWEADCGALPVIDGHGAPVAMITDRDICMAAHFQGAPLHVLRVRDAMSRTVYCCKPTDSVSAAESLMRENQIRRLPVVNDRNHVIGILSLNDIALEALAEAHASRKEITLKEVGETLSAICRHRSSVAVATA